MATETIYLLTRHKGSEKNTETEILSYCRDEYYDDLIPIILDYLEKDYVYEASYRYITRNMLPCDDEYYGSSKKDKRPIKEKELYKFLVNYFSKNDIYRVSSDLAYEVTIHTVPIPKKNWNGTYGNFRSTNTLGKYGRWKNGYQIIDDDEEDDSKALAHWWN